jgi:hypothetical protein
MDISENTSKNNWLISGMETLSRLATEISAGARITLQSLQIKSHLHTEIDRRDLDSLVQIRLPSLEQVLAGLVSIPEYSLLIGAGEDGSPILVDLSNSEAGSLLILGDPSSGKTRLMLSILSSACLINPPRKVRFSCITFKPGDLGWLNNKPHAYQIAAPYNEKAYQIITELANLLEQRRNGRQSGPAVILAIDGLEELVPSLDDELLDLLLWMIEYGPPYRIWTLATLDARKENLVQPEVLERFGTWLVGFMPTNPLGGQFSNPRFEKRMQFPDRLLPGAQFGVLVDGEWIPFWVPGIN